MINVCGNGGDYQFVKYSSINDEDESFWDKIASPYVLRQFRIAGGYWIGQQTLKVGRNSNGSTGTNYGAVTNYGQFPISAPQCGGTRTMLQYDNPGNYGDSGGPIYLSYNNAWYLAGVHNMEGDGKRWATPIWTINLPTGHSEHYCYAQNPCN